MLRNLKVLVNVCILFLSLDFFLSLSVASAAAADSAVGQQQQRNTNARCDSSQGCSKQQLFAVLHNSSSRWLDQGRHAHGSNALERTSSRTSRGAAGSRGVATSRKLLLGPLSVHELSPDAKPEGSIKALDLREPEAPRTGRSPIAAFQEPSHPSSSTGSSINGKPHTTRATTVTTSSSKAGSSHTALPAASEPAAAAAAAAAGAAGASLGEVFSRSWFGSPLFGPAKLPNHAAATASFLYHQPSGTAHYSMLDGPQAHSSSSSSTASRRTLGHLDGMHQQQGELDSEDVAISSEEPEEEVQYQQHRQRAQQVPQQQQQQQGIEKQQGSAAAPQWPLSAQQYQQYQQQQQQASASQTSGFLPHDKNPGGGFLSSTAPLCSIGRVIYSMWHCLSCWLGILQNCLKV